MSTQIGELQNQSNQNMNNSEIVGEIIKEMNTTDSQPQHLPMENTNNMYENSQQSQLERQMDSNTNILANDNLENIVDDSRPVINIDSEPELSLKDKLLNNFKNPALVSLVYFILSSPILNNLLATNLPKFFSSTISNSMRWVSVSLKALIAGVLYFLFKLVL